MGDVLPGLMRIAESRHKAWALTEEKIFYRKERESAKDLTAKNAKARKEIEGL